MIYWARTDENSNGQHEVSRRLLQMLRIRCRTATIHHVACKGRLTGFILTLTLSVWKHDPVIYISGASGKGMLVQLLQIIVLLLLPHRRIYFHVHSSRHLDGSFSMSVLARLERVVLVFLNAEMQERFTQAFTAIQGSVVIDNTVFFPAANTGMTKSSILFLSRAEYEKGIDRFLTLSDELAYRHPTLTFDVAGETTNPIVLQQITKRAHVSYHKEVSGAEKQTLLNRSAVFVFPSRYRVEAFSLSVIEAAAAGAFIVCSTAGFHSNFIQEIGGMEVHDWEDPSEICCRLDVLLRRSPASTNAYVRYRDEQLADLERWIDDLCPSPRCSY